ncbi:MAG TPA: PD-(D/E)XK nuclease family protein [Acidimicrobiales bacterium]|nr:PD-(D/E)XK nuclease family protein [Acidimicrobiales bacterium]
MILDPYGLLPAVTAGELRVLRQSTLGTADTCLKRLEYDLDPRIPYGTGEARAVGTGYHAGLECYYRWRQGEEVGGQCPTRDDSFAYSDPDLERFLMACIFAAAIEAFDREANTDGFQFDPESSRDRAVQKISRMLEEYFLSQRCYWPAGYEILAVEQEFLYPAPANRPGWAVKGTVDLILRDPNGWLIIVDHKTATRPWKKNKHEARQTNQPAWYLHHVRLLCTDPDTGEMPNVAFVFDVMTYDGKFERRPASRQGHEVAAVIVKAEHVMGLIERGGPYPPNVGSFLCSRRWCDHWLYCPFGEAMETGQGVPLPVAA